MINLVKRVHIIKTQDNTFRHLEFSWNNDYWILKDKVNEGNNQECGDNLRTKVTAGTPQGERGKAKNKAIGANSSTHGDNVLKQFEMTI